MASVQEHDVLRCADMRVLLMAVFHHTGDDKWLAEPYLPKRDVRLVADRDAGLSEDAQRDIRKEAARIIAEGFPAAAVVDPGNDLMVKMMRVCLGENVAPEYGPMMREEMGFASRDEGLRRDVVPNSVRSANQPHVIVVGAGVSGIALGAQLTRLGIPYVIFDAQKEVGGTWNYNRYPGCGVDTPNHAYSFSVGRRNRWTRYFALRPEIEKYIVDSAHAFGVYDNVKLQSEVVGARWDDDAQQWHVDIKTSDGLIETHTAPIFVSAIGGLSAPQMPKIPGMETFDGPLFHSCYWPDDLDVSGKKVALIGTGATSMQIATTIAPIVDQLTIYQRSPQWARDIKGYRDPIVDEELWLLENFPFYAEWFRFTMFWRYGDGLLPTLKKDPSWDKPERSVNRVNERHRVEMENYITSVIGHRPDLMEKCMPTYPPYGKRILLDNGWFEMLLRDNVELVTDAVQRIEPHGVVADALREADVVVMATGFDVHQFLGRLDIRGRNGQKLSELWGHNNPFAYLGLSVSGFPNLFMMSGPNTFLAHGGSLIFMAECQSRYITSAILQMFERGVSSIDVDDVVMHEYNSKVEAELEQLIWTHPGMTTWYRNEQGRVTAVLPWRLVDYWQLSHDPDFSAYQLTT